MKEKNLKEEKLEQEIARKEQELLKVNKKVEELTTVVHFLMQDVSDVSHKLDIEQRNLDSFYSEVNDETLRAEVEFLIENSGGKPRIDSVENVSIIVQASHEWYEPDGDGNFNPKRVEEFCNAFIWFVDEWKDDSGMTPVRAVLQMDERTPHIHATFVPFDPNGKLNCKYHLGGRQKLANLHDRFAESMKHLNIERGANRYREYIERASYVDIEEHAARTRPVRRKEPCEYYREVNAGKLLLTVEDLAMANHWTLGKLSNGMTFYYGREKYHVPGMDAKNPLYVINNETDEVFRARRNEQEKITFDPRKPVCNLNDAHALAHDYYNRSGTSYSDGETIACFANQMRIATGAPHNDTTMLARAQQTYDAHHEVQARETQQETREQAVTEHKTFYAPGATGQPPAHDDSHRKLDLLSL